MKACAQTTYAWVEMAVARARHVRAPSGLALAVVFMGHGTSRGWEKAPRNRFRLAAGDSSVLGRALSEQCVGLCMAGYVLFVGTSNANLGIRTFHSERYFKVYITSLSSGVTRRRLSDSVSRLRRGSGSGTAGAAAGRRGGIVLNADRTTANASQLNRK